MKLKALKAAFPFTIPIFAGFWFLGMAYGIYARSVGFSFWYPMIMSMTIFGGSLEFITVSMLLMPLRLCKPSLFRYWSRPGICSTGLPCWTGSRGWG